MIVANATIMQIDQVWSPIRVVEWSTTCCVHAAGVVKWRYHLTESSTWTTNRPRHSEHSSSRKREELGLSSRQLGELAGMDGVTILRFEEGAFAAPRPDKLARVAQELGLTLADVYAMADYAVPDDLPSFRPYLRTKYRDLPADDVEAIERYAARLAKKHGINLDGPAPGEDES
jgi:transcriptional regulator with XRE-family HTH domain